MPWTEYNPIPVKVTLDIYESPLKSLIYPGYLDSSVFPCCHYGLKSNPCAAGNMPRYVNTGYSFFNIWITVKPIKTTIEVCRLSRQEAFHDGEITHVLSNLCVVSQLSRLIRQVALFHSFLSTKWNLLFSGKHGDQSPYVFLWAKTYHHNNWCEDLRKLFRIIQNFSTFHENIQHITMA